MCCTHKKITKKFVSGHKWFLFNLNLLTVDDFDQLYAWTNLFRLLWHMLKMKRRVTCRIQHHFSTTANSKSNTKYDVGAIGLTCFGNCATIIEIFSYKQRSNSVHWIHLQHLQIFTLHTLELVKEKLALWQLTITSTVYLCVFRA